MGPWGSLVSQPVSSSRFRDTEGLGVERCFFLFPFQPEFLCVGLGLAQRSTCLLGHHHPAALSFALAVTLSKISFLRPEVISQRERAVNLRRQMQEGETLKISCAPR